MKYFLKRHETPLTRKYCETFALPCRLPNQRSRAAEKQHRNALNCCEKLAAVQIEYDEEHLKLILQNIKFQAAFSRFEMFTNDATRCFLSPQHRGIKDRFVR